MAKWHSVREGFAPNADPMGSFSLASSRFKDLNFVCLFVVSVSPKQLQSLWTEFEYHARGNAIHRDEFKKILEKLGIFDEVIVER